MLFHFQLGDYYHYKLTNNFNNNLIIILDMLIIYLVSFTKTLFSTHVIIHV